MELPRNTFKHALKAGKAQIGLWSSLSSPYTVEVIAGAGFDWLLLDMEHSPSDLENLLSQLQAAAPYATHPDMPQFHLMVRESARDLALRRYPFLERIAPELRPPVRT